MNIIKTITTLIFISLIGVFTLNFKGNAQTNSSQQNYIIVTSLGGLGTFSTPEADLQDKVNQYIQQGYTPIGGVFGLQGIREQSMILSR